MKQIREEIHFIKYSTHIATLNTEKPLKIYNYIQGEKSHSPNQSTRHIREQKNTNAYHSILRKNIMHN